MTLPEALQAAEQHRRAGRLDAAVTLWRAVLAAAPAQHGVRRALAMALHDAGRHVEAVDVFVPLLPLAIDSFEVQAAAGQSLLAVGRRDEAIECFRRALALNPAFAPLQGLLGAVLALAGERDEAEQALRRAIALAPGDAAFHQNLGVVLRDGGRQAEAAACFRRVLELQPASTGARHDLGVALLALGDGAGAESCFRAVLATGIDDIAVDNNLAASLNAQKKFLEAEAVLRAALARHPGEPTLQANLGQALLNQCRSAEAEAELRAALALRPDDASATSHLVVALLAQGRVSDALAVAGDFPARFPHALKDGSAVLFALQCDEGCTPERYLAMARTWGHSARARARPCTGWRVPSPGTALPRLRVGLVSGDLRVHPVGWFLASVLEAVDPSRIEFVAYSTRRADDAVSARIRKQVALWRDVERLDDAAAAAQVHDDGVHVLLDLAGHTTYNRLPLFAWKPAPLQGSWLGYFASTGVPGIDFVLVDRVSVLPGEDTHFSEQPVFLRDTRLCFTPPSEAEAPPVAPLPALTNGHVTFGSFQNRVKLNDGTLRLWAAVLDRVAGSRLRIQDAEMHFPESRRQLLARFATRGIDTGRVDLVGSVPRADYLAAHAAVDILLDTVPYPGGTTTCEALWMGVPTLSLRGHSLLSRQGASLLTAAGLPEWIAEDREDYVDRAAAMAGNLPALADLRRGLREHVRQSTLCDATRFARALEDALHEAWLAGPQPQQPATGES